MSPITCPITTEVTDLHCFLQRWFNGVEPKTRQAFSRLSSVWPAGFTLVDPHNGHHDGAALLASTYDQHGAFPQLAIEIRSVKVNSTAPGVAVATFEEWHRDAQEVDARLCSATIVHGPTGLQWVHAHESRLAWESLGATP